MEEKTTDKNIRKNPFFEPYTTPHCLDEIAGLTALVNETFNESDI